MFKRKQLFQLMSSLRWRYPYLNRLTKEVEVQQHSQRQQQYSTLTTLFCIAKANPNGNERTWGSFQPIIEIGSNSGLGYRTLFVHPISNFQYQSIHLYQQRQRAFQEQKQDRPNFNFRGSNYKMARIAKKIWAIFKVVLLVSGAAVWGGGAIALLFIDEVRVEEIGDLLDLSPVNDELKLRTLTFYDVLKENDSVNDITESMQEEITFKDRSFKLLWNKLKNEETIKLKFGDPVQICGFRCAKILHDKRKHSGSPSNLWYASCYVEGSKGIGILKMKFERSDSDIEWVITSAHLQLLETTNEVLCDVSGSLPNGLTRFTRLSKNI